MGETEDANACGASEGIKLRRLHFDGKNALVSRRLNGVGGFAERRVRCPARADNAARPCPLRAPRQPFSPDWRRRRRTRTEERSDSSCPRRATSGRSPRNRVGPGRGNLPCRGQAHEQLASASKQFFSDEDGEGRANRTADDPDAAPAKLKAVEFRMIARPTRKGFRHAHLA